MTVFPSAIIPPSSRTCPDEVTHESASPTPRLNSVQSVQESCSVKAG